MSEPLYVLLLFVAVAGAGLLIIVSVAVLTILIKEWFRKRTKPFVRRRD